MRKPLHIKHLLRAVSRRAAAMGIVVFCVILASALLWHFDALHTRAKTINTQTEIVAQSKGPSDTFTLSGSQWSQMETEPVASHVFRPAHVTEGKVAVNEDQATPVFSPYAGRVTKLSARPGDLVTRGQPLFSIEATDMVQAQNDFLTANSGIAKARSRLTLTEIVEKQNRRLFNVKAAPQRDLQQAEADLAQARSELQAAETTLEAARNRLRILGKTDEEIATFQQKGLISPETPIFSPIDGTVVQRRIGPGQYVSYTSTGSVDPVFLIGDLSSVWLVAYIRETDAGKVRIGQPMEFTVLSYPDQIYRANINYVAAVMDSNIRRLLVRATIPNADLRLKPEMYANVRITTDEGDSFPAVSRQSIIYDGQSARVWVVRQDRTIERRQITPGLSDGSYVQVLSGVRVGESVISKGNLFLDRAASGN